MVEPYTAADWFARRINRSGGAHAAELLAVTRELAELTVTPVMPDTGEYLHRAIKADGYAKSARDPALGLQWSQIAEQWRAMARPAADN